MPPINAILRATGLAVNFTFNKIVFQLLHLRFSKPALSAGIVRAAGRPHSPACSEAFHIRRATPLHFGVCWRHHAVSLRSGVMA